MTQSPDRFVHHNRPLREWLLQLVDEDASKRKAAAKVVSEQFYLPLTLAPDTKEGMELFLGEFGVKVREAVNAPDFPAAAFVENLLSLDLALHESWCEMNREQFKREDEADDAELEKLRENPTPGATKRYVRRLWIRALRDCKRICEDEPHEAMTTGMAAAQVIESLGKELLLAPDVLREMMASRSKAHLAFDAIGRMGRDGLALYDDLLAGLKRDDPNYYSSRALGAVLQSAPEKVPQILQLAADPDLQVRINAIRALGAGGRKGTSSFPQVESQLRAQLANCQDEREWHSLAHALADIGQTSDTVRLLMGFLDEPDKRGPVIGALGRIGKESELVLPRLIELLDAFEEYDPDLCYHGEHERVIHALRGFGADAAVAVPALVRHIWTKPQQYWTKEHQVAERPEPDEEVIRFLGEIGEPARQALPVLLEVQAEMRKRRAAEMEADGPSHNPETETTDEEETYLELAIKKIQQAKPVE